MGGWEKCRKCVLHEKHVLLANGFEAPPPCKRRSVQQWKLENWILTENKKGDAGKKLKIQIHAYFLHLVTVLGLIIFKCYIYNFSFKFILFFLKFTISFGNPPPPPLVFKCTVLFFLPSKLVLIWSHKEHQESS